MNVRHPAFAWLDTITSQNLCQSLHTAENIGSVLDWLADFDADTYTMEAMA
jgi:hypothetical protein